jgi:hypothetical protein
MFFVGLFVVLHSTGRPFSAERHAPSGPRNCGQFCAVTLAGKRRRVEPRATPARVLAMVKSGGHLNKRQGAVYHREHCWRRRRYPHPSIAHRASARIEHDAGDRPTRLQREDAEIRALGELDIL